MLKCGKGKAVTMLDTKRLKFGHPYGQTPPNIFSDFIWLGDHRQELLEKNGECSIVIYKEQVLGVGRSQEFEILAWFVDSAEYLVGFGGVLERCILHLDMPNLAGIWNFQTTSQF